MYHVGMSFVIRLLSLNEVVGGCDVEVEVG